ncbi:GAP family protein [Photobacterium satsumensis]|uniref:GAP family protein n=1 Tax=Photobacterium satsumensis TaxID=2910239 RepID=UPI003D09A231
MISLLIILIAIALVDSTSMIPIGLLPLAAILGGKRPITGALCFIFGIFLVYSLSGLLLLVGFDLVFEVINPIVSRWWNQPNTAELVLQLIVGVALLIYAWKQYRLPQISTSTGSEESISPTRAFTLGLSLTVIGVPGAVPYFGAIEQILRADLNSMGSIGALLFYNVVFVAPFFALLLIRLVAPNKSESIFGSISQLIKRFGKPAMVSCLVVLGVVLSMDSIGWFLGYPLLPTN